MPSLDFGTVSTVSDFFVNNNGGCALLTDGNTKCWGTPNSLIYSKDLAWGTQASHVSAPRTAIFPSGSIKKVSLGTSTACAVSDLGAVRCWGGTGSLGNPYAYLNGKNIFQTVGSGAFIADVDFGSTGPAVDVTSAGASHCAVFSDGRVKCWGDNSSGQLGYGDTVSRGNAYIDLGNNLPYVDLGTGRTVKQLVGSNYNGYPHHCAILDNNKVKCWGDGNYGALGYGNSANIGNIPGQMGDSLPYVDLGTGRTAKLIALNGIQSCAVLDNDSLKCWGHTNTGTYGDAPGEMGDSLPTINLGGRKPVQLEASQYAGICLLFDDETVRCIDGYISNLTTVSTSIDFGAGKKAVKLSSGGSGVCAQLDTNEVKCFGNNAYGQLGHSQFNTSLNGQSALNFGDNATDFLPSWPNTGF